MHKVSVSVEVCVKEVEVWYVELEVVDVVETEVAVVEVLVVELTYAVVVVVGSPTTTTSQITGSV